MATSLKSTTSSTNSNQPVFDQLTPMRELQQKRLQEQTKSAAKQPLAQQPAHPSSPNPAIAIAKQPTPPSTPKEKPIAATVVTTVKAEKSQEPGPVVDTTLNAKAEHKACCTSRTSSTVRNAFIALAAVGFAVLYGIYGRK